VRENQRKQINRILQIRKGRGEEEKRKREEEKRKGGGGGGL